ncbi:MAG: acyl carrier protein [Rubrivivax sp.]|nr:acyl carrier protein [Rubrivivax sp.]
MTDIHERLITILVRGHRLAPERLGLDAPLQGLGIDSLATIELLWDIEDQFQIKLPADPTGLVTVGDVVTLIDVALRPQPHADAAAETTVVIGAIAP